MDKAKEFLKITEADDTPDIFPVRVESGQIVSADGKALVKANRETGTTPLAPWERDSLLKFIAKLLNDNQAGFKAILKKGVFPGKSV